MRNFADDRVGGVGQEDTEDDVELDQADQASAHAGGGDFGGVNGSDHGGQADADAAQEAEHHEEGDRERGRRHKLAVPDRIERRNRCQGCGQGSDAEEDTDPEEDGFTPKAVGELTGDNGAEYGADGRNGDDHALAHGGESVKLGEFFFRTRDDGCVKTEEQAAEGGDDRASNDQGRNGSR